MSNGNGNASGGLKNAKGRASRNAAGRPSAWERVKNALEVVNRRFAYIVGLPVVAALVPVVVGHFQYLSAYQDKVKEVGAQEVKAAEDTFGEVSRSFSSAITLQQILYYDYRDAVRDDTDADDTAMETKSARAIAQKYEELRTQLRQSIDMLARRVEMNLDWASDPYRDGADAGLVGADPMSRIILGAYDFDCDRHTPNFRPGDSRITIPVPREMRERNPKASPLVVDWHSAKHEVLTLYYCFDKAHRQIEAARRWAANSKVSPDDRAAFKRKLPEIQATFDGVAVRLDKLLTLAGRQIETIRVKYRPQAWYCHVPIVREIVDGYSKNCTPLRTARSKAS